MAGPITPKEAHVVLADLIPEFVYEVFNELIVKNMTSGIANILLEDVKERLEAKRPPGVPYEEFWLDVEPAYRLKGWVVSFEKPDWGSLGKSYYTFKPGRLS